MSVFMMMNGKRKRKRKRKRKVKAWSRRLGVNEK